MFNEYIPKNNFKAYLQVKIQSQAAYTMMNEVLTKQEQLVLQTDYLTIRVVPGQQLLLSDWSGWLNTSKGKNGCLAILDKVKEYGITKILNDNSKVTGHSGETSWMHRVWVPSLLQAGVKYFAWVYSYEFFTQMEIDNTLDKSTGIAMRAFFLPEDAFQWLLMH